MGAVDTQRLEAEVEEKRRQLRATFDEVATLYDQVRPGYPEAVFDDIVSLSAIPPGGRILEIGCGTGQATLPFARRGYRILCIELGENMAAVARHNLSVYPHAEVRTVAFEDWPPEEEAFDLAISATAFHWINPADSYGKIARALKPGGALALFWNIHVQNDASNGFFEAAQVVYLRETRTMGREEKGIPYADEVPMDTATEIENTGLFGEVTVRRYLWDATYDAGSYIRVLNTYSNHRTLDSDTRERLFRGIAQLIDTEFGGRITKAYMTDLYLARRR